MESRLSSDEVWITVSSSFLSLALASSPAALKESPKGKHVLGYTDIHASIIEVLSLLSVVLEDNFPPSIFDVSTTSIATISFSPPLSASPAAVDDVLTGQMTQGVNGSEDDDALCPSLRIQARALSSSLFFNDVNLLEPYFNLQISNNNSTDVYEIINDRICHD